MPESKKRRGVPPAPLAPKRPRNQRIDSDEEEEEDEELLPEIELLSEIDAPEVDAAAELEEESEGEDQMIIAAMKKPSGAVDYKVLWEGEDLNKCLKWPVLVRAPMIDAALKSCL